MKGMKKIICHLLAVVMTLSVCFAVNGTEAKAADGQLKAPKHVRCGAGLSNGTSVDIPISAKKGDIKNIKVYKGKKKSKDAAAKKTYLYRSESYQSYATLQVHAKKAGKYIVKYDVYEDGKKKGKTRSFTVHADGYGDVISSVTIDKKNVTKYVSGYQPDGCYTTKDKIKINFKVAKGCKIKKIEMTYFNKKGELVTKKIKNGQKVTLGNYAGKSSDSWSRWASTRFDITYTDSYDQYSTKAKRTTSYYVYKMV